MKAIMISVHAKWCALEMNGIKTIEVRKGTALYKATQKLIDKYGFAEFYVYCTKDRTLCYDEEQKLYFKGVHNLNKISLEKHWVNEELYNDILYEMNCKHLEGKVAFKFRCYKVEEIYYECGNNGISVDGYKWFYTEELDLVQDFEKASCLNENELFNYLKPKEAGGTPCGTAIHISDLEIFDKPKELSEFYHYVKYDKEMAMLNKQDWDIIKLNKAPESWCYVEADQ